MPDGIIQFCGDDLVAEFDALVADPRVRGRCHGHDVAALPAAEAAPLGAVRIFAQLPDGGDGLRVTKVGVHLREHPFDAH